MTEVQLGSRSVASLRDAAVDARREFEDALPLATERWDEQFLEPEDGGSEAWSPHTVAAHAILGERWRFRYIARLLEQPRSETLSQAEFSALPSEVSELRDRGGRVEAMADATAAVAAAAAEWVVVDDVFGRITNEDLARPTDLSDGQLDYLETMGLARERTLWSLLSLASVHLLDHARQLRAAV